MRFPSYELSPSVDIFPSRLAFEQWEAANELQYIVNRVQYEN